MRALTMKQKKMIHQFVESCKNPKWWNPKDKHYRTLCEPFISPESGKQVCLLRAKDMPIDVWEEINALNPCEIFHQNISNYLPGYTVEIVDKHQGEE